jgi:hypothetical protein
MIAITTRSSIRVNPCREREMPRNLGRTAKLQRNETKMRNVSAFEANLATRDLQAPFM